MLESVQSLNEKYGDVLFYAEWIFTIFFTIEYLLRVYISDKPLKYIFSFYGMVDFLSIVPSYIGIFVLNTQYLKTIRVIRLMRVFRVLKLVRYSSEAEGLALAIYESRRRIVVFMGAVVALAIIMGTIIYIIEPHDGGFTSIPESIYWAIVTITTVGYGDISPQTWLGQAFAAGLMLIGYVVIAVPTGIVSAEYALGVHKKKNAHKNVNRPCNIEPYSGPYSADKVAIGEIKYEDG